MNDRVRNDKKTVMDDVGEDELKGKMYVRRQIV